MADEGLSGRELDARVAERVMGWTDVRIQPIANVYGERVIDEYCGRAPGGAAASALVPRYGTMIQDAWNVAEKLRREQVFVTLISGRGPSGASQPWICKVNLDGAFIEERGETAPLALCRAALRVNESAPQVH